MSGGAYRHPAAWLLGLEGVALLRAQAGDDLGGEAFVRERLAEIERILAVARSGQLGEGAVLPEIDVATGYRSWSGTYDTEDNPLLAAEVRVVRPLLADLPPASVVLDAACGTGRHAATLVELGHSVIGVDGSAAMLDAARNKVSAADLRIGDLSALPLPDSSVDHAVCSIALTYLPDLAGPLRELRRVVRRGGTVVLSDMHWLSLYLGGVSGARTDDGGWGLMPAYRHLPSDYVATAVAVGFEVLGCWEPRWGPVAGEGGPLAQEHCPEASAAAYRETPAAIVWHLRARSDS